MINANFTERFLERLKNIYGLDKRALSLMRIGAGVVLLLDLFIRANSLTAHYTAAGAVPFNEVELSYWQNGYFTLFRICDEYWFALLLFITTGFIYCGMLLGYKTRLFTFLAWVMLTSLQNRNTLILQGGDDELRLLVFWGIFLPWGNFYSVDARNKTSEPHDKYLSLSGLGYLMLIFSVYFFSGILKNSSEWGMSEGTAIYYAFNLDQMVWPLGKWLLSYPSLLKFLSVTIKWVEILSPFLLFVPFRNSLFRMIFVILIVSFHLGISLTLFVGLFYLTGIASLLGLLSPKVMDKFDRKFNLNKNITVERRDSPLLQKLRNNYYFKVVLNSILFFFIALSLIWNLSTVANSGLGVSPNFFPVGYALRLNQNWGMFAPTVLKDDGWFVMEGWTKNKNPIDINRKGKVADFNKPGNLMEYIKDDRWRKFGENYMLAVNTFMRDYYCRYLIKDWNALHPENRIDSLTIFYMKESTPPPGKPAIISQENLCVCQN